MSQDDDTTKSDTTTGVAVDAAPNPENDHKVVKFIREIVMYIKLNVYTLHFIVFRRIL